MSSISGLSSAAGLYSPSQTTNSGATNPLLQDLNALGTALQSGDTSSAQSALSSLQ
jgi:hypothetical protein